MLFARDDILRWIKLPHIAFLSNGCADCFPAGQALQHRPRRKMRGYRHADKNRQVRAVCYMEKERANSIDNGGQKQAIAQSHVILKSLPAPDLPVSAIVHPHTSPNAAAL